MCDVRRGRRLVAAVEIISPANKDRAENRQQFTAKCAALLRQGVSLVLVDLVTVREFNLYYELLQLIGERDPALNDQPPATYAAACRWRPRSQKSVVRGVESSVNTRPTAPLSSAVADRRLGNSVGSGSQLRKNLSRPSHCLMWIESRTLPLTATRQVPSGGRVPHYFRASRAPPRGVTPVSATPARFRRSRK